MQGSRADNKGAYLLPNSLVNISDCQAKPFLAFLCRLEVRDNFLLHQSS